MQHPRMMLPSFNGVSQRKLPNQETSRNLTPIAAESFCHGAWYDEAALAISSRQKRWVYFFHRDIDDSGTSLTRFRVDGHPVSYERKQLDGRSFILDKASRRSWMLRSSVVSDPKNLIWSLYKRQDEHLLEHDFWYSVLGVILYLPLWQEHHLILPAGVKCGGREKLRP